MLATREPEREYGSIVCIDYDFASYCTSTVRVPRVERNSFLLYTTTSATEYRTYSNRVVLSCWLLHAPSAASAHHTRTVYAAAGERCARARCDAVRSWGLGGAFELRARAPAPAYNPRRAPIPCSCQACVCAAGSLSMHYGPWRVGVASASHVFGSRAWGVLRLQRSL